MTDTITATLLVSDRCDRCGAQAFVLVRGVTGELMFCSHHFNKFETGLRDFSYEIVDERDRLSDLD